jgi:DNA-binding transcriptional regulator WhiA
MTSQEIFDGTITDMSKHFIPKRARNFELGKNGVFTISKIKNFHSRVSKVFYKKQFKDLVLDEVLFASFMGIYLAEGCCSTSKNSYKISIYQNKLDNVEKIDNLLKSLNFHYHKRERKIGGFVFEIIDARLYNFLIKLV